jgi:hypothetical protein
VRVEELLSAVSQEERLSLLNHTRVSKLSRKEETVFEKVDLRVRKEAEKTKRARNWDARAAGLSSR